MTEAGSSSAQETLQPDRNGETEQNDQHHGRSAQLENCLIVSSSNLCTSSCKVGKKGPWTLILTSSFPHEFTTTSAINPWPETAVFFSPAILTPPTHVALDTLGLNLGSLSSTWGLLNLFRISLFWLWTPVRCYCCWLQGGVKHLGAERK